MVQQQPRRESPRLKLRLGRIAVFFSTRTAPRSSCWKLGRPKWRDGEGRKRALKPAQSREKSPSANRRQQHGRETKQEEEGAVKRRRKDGEKKVRDEEQPQPAAIACSHT